MSFQDKIAQLMVRPGQDPVAKDDVPWWMKYAGRGVGSVGGFIAIFLAVWNLIGIVLMNIDCFLSGVWQLLAGFIMICIEAPCCCLFIDYVQRFSDWVENRPYWNRAAGYAAISIPPIILCPGFSSIFGSGLIMTCGIIYGMMALGRKATAEEMRQSAAAQDPKFSSSNIFNSNGSSSTTTSQQANLVSNAQPISFAGTPLYDSNV